MKTKITELLGIRYPIIQGGMAWVADAELAGAVSEAGGLGLIAGGAAPADVICAEIHKLRKITSKPFGLNIMLKSPFAGELAELAVAERVPVVTTGAGNPGVYMPSWKAAGIKIIPVVPTAALALRMERLGADAIIAEGCEAGGHIGDMTTMALIPQVADAISIPLVAAGGIADGRGAAAAFMLGAHGVQCGTCFLTADECTIHETYKEMVLKAKDTGTMVTGRSLGRPIRSLKSPFVRAFLEKEKQGISIDELETIAAGSLRKAAKEGNMEHGTFMAGQIAGLITKRKPCQCIIEDIFTHAADILRKAAYLLDE